VGAMAPNSAINSASHTARGWRKRWKFIWTGRKSERVKADYPAGRVALSTVVAPLVLGVPVTVKGASVTSAAWAGPAARQSAGKESAIALASGQWPVA
jgi:hypothetical protein